MKVFFLIILSWASTQSLACDSYGCDIWGGVYATTGTTGYDFASSIYDISSYSLSSSYTDYSYTSTIYDSYTYDYSYPSYGSYSDPYSFSNNYNPSYYSDYTFLPSTMPYYPTTPDPIVFLPQPQMPYPILSNNPIFNFPMLPPNRWTVPRDPFIGPYNPIIPPTQIPTVNPIPQPPIIAPTPVGPIDRPTVTPTPIFTTPISTPTTPLTPSPSYQYNSGDPVRYQVPRASH